MAPRLWRVGEANIVDRVITPGKLAAHLQGITGVSEPIRSKLVCGFQDDETWAETTCTLVRDVTPANVKFGDRSLKMTVATTATGLAECTLTNTVDIRSDLGIWVKVDTVANVNEMGIFLYADDGGGSPEAAPHRGYWYTGSSNYYGLADGVWKLIRFPRALLTASGAPTAWNSASPVKTVRKIRLHASANANGGINVHWGLITSLAPERAGLVLMIDDAHSPDGPAVIEPALTARGWPACTCICGDFFGDAGYMPTADLLALQAKGWDILVHNWAHGAGYTTDTTTATVRSDFSKVQKMFADLGLFRGAQFLIWPGNAGTSAVDADTGEYAGDLAKRFFLGCRGWCKFKGVTTNSNLYLNKANCWIPRNWHELAYYPLYTTDNNDFSAAAEPWLNAMVADRLVGFPYTHNIKVSPGASDVSLAFWAGMLAWLDANVYHPTNNPGGMVELMTMTQWYNRTVGRPGNLRTGYEGAIYATDGAGTVRLIG